MRHDIAKWNKLRRWLRDVREGRAEGPFMTEWEIDLLLRNPHPLVDSYPLRVFSMADWRWLEEIPTSVPEDIREYTNDRTVHVRKNALKAVEIVFNSSPKVLAILRQPDA